MFLEIMCRKHLKMLPAADFLVNFQCLDFVPSTYSMFLNLEKSKQDLLMGYDLQVIKFVLEIAKLYEYGL